MAEVALAVAASSPVGSAAVLQQGWRFVRGLRDFLRDPVTPDEIRATFTDELATRDERFLELLDTSVWPYPLSPYHQLLDNAGLDAGAVAALVRAEGIDGTLRSLRDAGVYVAYEEFHGNAPARRGSATFHFSPDKFFNQGIRGQYTTSTGATSSAGTTAPVSFSHVRALTANALTVALLWDVIGIPHAVWFPALPASSGLHSALMWTSIDGPVERWFSPTSPAGASVARHKRLVNVALPLAAIGTGMSIPRPRLTTSPEPVLEWCRDALGRRGRAHLGAYPTSVALLAELAVDRGVSLEGLLVVMGGEPLTPAKLQRVRAAGIRPINSYGSTHIGLAATACPSCDAEEVHVHMNEFAVVTRARERPDGVGVDAYCWTNLSGVAPLISLNLENDDYGQLIEDGPPCGCELDRLGARTRLRGMRGMSKVVAGGTTVPGEVFERLIDELLPARFGGTGTHYQFRERDDDGRSRIVLRVDPDLGPIDHDAIAELVRERLDESEAGRLATSVWSRGSDLVVEREVPVRTKSGKVMPFDSR